MRLIPQVRELCERARRPTLRMTLGAALMLPAAAMMAQGRMEQLDTAGTAVDTTGAAVDPMLRQWSQHVLERERQLVVASFAREFDIPVELADDIHEAALAEDISPRVAFGLVKAESSFRTRAVSPVGAVGLTQLLPSTARWMVPGTTRRDLMTPETNLRVGFRYLRHLIDRFDGDAALALTAYNRGPGTVNKLIDRGQDPDNGYAEKVLTGESTRHVKLMNAKFGRSRGRS